MNDDDAAQIVTAARHRALGTRPRLRRLSVLLWASFLGAALSLIALLLWPEDVPLPPQSLGDAARLFALLWALALVPATTAALLAEARTSP